MAQAVAGVVQAGLGSAEVAQQDRREAAPKAVALLLETIEDEGAPRAARVRAAELIVHASGALLERVDVTVGLPTRGGRRGGHSGPSRPSGGGSGLTESVGAPPHRMSHPSQRMLA